MISRFIASIVTVGVWYWASFYAQITSGMLSAEVAGHQFDNSDSSYLFAQGVMRFLSNFPGTVSLFFVVLLALIWAGPVRRLVAAAKADWKAGGFAVLLALLMSQPFPVKAYYETTDFAESYFIQPNESAFFIPDQGANKDSQAKFGSEDYYKENKIAAKRFDMKHQTLPSSGWFKNMVVPTGRLIIVDRTPVARTWVAQAHRGTSKLDQSFPCQTKEGIDAAIGVAIGANVHEEDAPKFLYKFGVHPPQGDRSDPKVIFTSVYNGFSLAEVMDSRIQPKIQALVCDKFTMYTVDELNEKLSSDIMPAIQKEIRDYLKDDGITLDFIGWADTITFPDKVQDGINRKFIAGKEAEIAKALGPVTDTLQKLAIAEAVRTMAGKWDGKMPQALTSFGGEFPGILGAILSNPPGLHPEAAVKK